jgi:hypothetical protein
VNLPPVLELGVYIGGTWIAIATAAWLVRDYLERREQARDAANRESNVLALRDLLESREHRTMIREESVEALRSPAGRDELRFAAREAAIEAFQGMAAPITEAQRDHERRMKDLEASRTRQGERLGELERWKGSAEVMLQSVGEHEHRVSALERGFIRVGEIMRRHKLVDSEETGT